MPPSNSIFLSYRRSDSHDITGRIYDRLAEHFGRDVVFKDVDSIPFGDDFRTHLNQGVGRCLVLVAVIGPTWLDVSEADGQRRVDNPNDWVRVELETALGREIPVIPLLVGGARLPRADELPETLKELPNRGAAQARPDPDFHPDLDRLIRRLEEIVELAEPSITLKQPIDVPQPKVQEPMEAKRSSNSREGFYSKQISQLEERLAAVEADLESASREEERMGLVKRAEVILSQIDDLKAKLNSL